MTIGVFLVDDHAVVRDGLRLLLTTQPDIVVVGDASNGADAVQAIAAMTRAGAPPTIAVVDIAMPGISGIEALRQLGDVCPEVKGVILSMYSTREHVSRAFQAGARGYLLKESAGLEVIEAVRAVHDGQVYVSKKLAAVLPEEYARWQGQANDSDPLALLSEREREVLQRVVVGKTSAEIAVLLTLSPQAVDACRSRFMQKLNVHDLPGLIGFATQHGLIPPE